MAEYIERARATDALIDNTSLEGYDLEEAVNAICAIPAADVRPVVLCKDCKNRFNIDVCRCRGDDWFCGYGERKRDES